MANSFAFMIPLTQETKIKSRVSFKLDITLVKCKVIGNFVMDYECTTNSALLKDGNLLTQRQPETVLAPVTYRSSRRRHQQKLVLLKDGAYYCYCAYVLRISRYLGFLSVIFLRSLKLSGESRS